MFERYPASENPLQEEAIVLVDEIDLHLHPAWQRDIISFLSKVFPNVQFIVTTHSPLVVQSMNEVNLYVLHREGNKVKVDRSEVTNFKGWTVEEILRDTMRMKEDIHTGEYQKYMKLFDEGLDESDREKLKAAYETLCRILHPENSARRLLELQYNQLLHD
jgi:predicted ATP-binding protein involved in virulence